MKIEKLFGRKFLYFIIDDEYGGKTSFEIYLDKDNVVCGFRDSWYKRIQDEQFYLNRDFPTNLIVINKGNFIFYEREKEYKLPLNDFKEQ